LFNAGDPVRIGNTIDRLLKLALSIAFYELKALIKAFTKIDNGKLTIVTFHSLKEKQVVFFKRQMDELLKVARPVPIDFDPSIREGGHFVAITFDDGFQSVLHNALPVLRARQIPATLFITTGYLGRKPGWIKDPLHPNADEILLTEEQIKQLPQDLVAIGSHTITHPRLTNIDEDSVIKEIGDSKSYLENLLNRQITLFSLPYGAFNIAQTKLFKEAGYKRVFLNVPNFPSSKTGNYYFGRIDITMDDWPIEYRLKFLGAYQWLSLAITLKNKLISTHVYLKRIINN
jgi:peptidoglycan/xylan/chitin deacetylase (PgdA/CDA1 family)